MELRETHASITIRDHVAHKQFRLHFHNSNTAARTEAEFFMELEPEQKVDRFRVTLGGKEAEAELLDQDKARKIYEEIVRKQKDPALLEHYGSRLLRIRLFPIPPRSDFHVLIETLETLRPENGVVRVETMHARPSTFKQPLRHVTLEATVESTTPIETLFSPTHTVDVNRKNANEARLRFERKNYVPTDPLTFYYTLQGGAKGVTLLAFEEPGEDGSFMMTITPPEGTEERLPRDILFLVDRSGSMATKGQMARARAALQTFVEGLDPKDRFNIIPFSTEASQFHREFVPATEPYRNHARRYIETLSARGGTNLEEALALAGEHELRADATPILLLLSDGVPTIGERDTDKLVGLAGRVDARLFSFGIGFEVNSQLLDKLSLTNGGDRQYVHPNEDLELVLESFARKIDAPILADPVVRFAEDADVSDHYPKKLPTLFRGGSLQIFGRYRGAGPREIELTGTVRGRAVTHRYTVEFTPRERYDFVPRLWAIQKIDFLLDQIRTHGTSKELVDHIVEIAKHHGIVTPYTSFLMVEDTPTAAANRHVVDNVRESLANSYKGQREFLKAGNKLRWRAAQTQEAQMYASNEALARDNSVRNIADLRSKQRQVGARTFYNARNAWADARYKAQKARVLKFASAEYFRFLQENPRAGRYLSLGKNVTFWNHREWVRVEG